MDPSVLTDEFPSMTNLSQGYVDGNLLYGFYRVDEESFWKAPGVCIHSCHKSDAKDVPPPDDGEGHRDQWAYLISPDMQPGLPTLPGHPGVLLSTHAFRTDTTWVSSGLRDDERCFPLFRRSPGYRPKYSWPDRYRSPQYLYLGEYGLSQSRQLSLYEWSSLPEEVSSSYFVAAVTA